MMKKNCAGSFLPQQKPFHVPNKRNSPFHPPLIQKPLILADTVVGVYPKII
jgi:hypothetical protein